MGRVILVTRDLLMRSRVEAEARRAGVSLEVVRPGDPLDPDAGLLLLDLEAWIPDEVPAPAVGFYPHVDEGLARAATARGITPLPRGGFLKRLPEILAGQSPEG